MGFLGNATTQTDFFEDKQSELAYYGSECDGAYTNEIIKACTKRLRANYFRLLQSPIPVSRKIIMSMFVMDYRLAKLFISIVKKIYDYNG